MGDRKNGIPGDEANSPSVEKNNRQGKPADIRRQNKTFKDAVKEINRKLGRSLTDDQRRELHQEITGQDYDHRDIVNEGLDMFGD